MHELEAIPYTEVRDSRNRIYAEWRKSLRPRFVIAWRDIALGYLALAGLLYGATLLTPDRPLLTTVLAFFLSIAIGFTFAYLGLFIHEAGHFNLHPDKKKNDRLTSVFLGALFGIDIKSYRKIHWQHHLHLGTPGDTEVSYHHALTPLFLLESFTGIHLLRVMRKKNNHTALTGEMKRDTVRMLLLGGALNAAILGVLLLFGYWAAALAWALGMLLFFPFFATLRQILEHRDEWADKTLDFRLVPHGKIVRLFTSGPFSSIFGGAGFNRHLIHHWDPQVSYTRLKDVESFLTDCPKTKPLVQSAKTTYAKTFRKLLFE